MPQHDPESVTWPTLDDCNIPTLPPPSRSHIRSRSAIDIPLLLPRRDSQSPTRSSTYLPFVTSSRSPSPKRQNQEVVLDDTTAQQTRTRTKTKVGNLATWFEGFSDPVNIGLVAAEQPVSSSLMQTPFAESRESLHLAHILPQRPAMQSACSSTSRFGFFTRKPPEAQSKADHEALAAASIASTLFPNGTPDEFSQVAFKKLQQNAENALRILQAAHTEQVAALRKATSERNIQADELEASVTRNEHLKAQLLELAERSAQQDKLISSLQTENEQLKANETALRSIRVITDYTSPNSQEPKLQNRSSRISSAESTNSASTDMSGTNASVFSNDDVLNERSPGTSVGCPSPSPTLKRARCRATTPSVSISQVEHLKSLTTNIETVVGNVPAQMQACPICHGVDPHEAWNVLGVIRAENAGLKDRIMELENGQDAAMGLLDWRPVELQALNTRVERIMSKSDDDEVDSDMMRGTIC